MAIAWVREYLTAGAVPGDIEDRNRVMQRRATMFFQRYGVLPNIYDEHAPCETCGGPTRTEIEAGRPLNFRLCYTIEQKT